MSACGGLAAHGDLGRQSWEAMFHRRFIAAFLFGVVAPAAQADSIVTIVGQLKSSRDGSLELFSAISTSLEEAGASADATAVKKWSDDWLSILGMQRGLTGLVKDFVLNYLGRSSYHENNGPLINAIKTLAGSIPKKVDAMSDKVAKSLFVRLSEVCNEGMGIFASGGSLHTMLKELRALLKEQNLPHFVKGFASNAEIRRMLAYLAGPRPDDRDYDNIGDEEL